MAAGEQAGQQLAERAGQRSTGKVDTDSEVAMTALTRFVLRHKALVTLFWVVVAAVRGAHDQRHHRTG